MQKLIETYENFRKKILYHHFCSFIIGWDSETEAPEGCFGSRSEQMGVGAEESYRLRTDPAYIEAVNGLFEQRDQLDPVLKHEIEEVKKSLDKTLKIPMEMQVEMSKLLAGSQNVWAKAKRSDDFELFKPYLGKIFDFTRKYISFLETDELKGYDVLLDEYEPGFTQKEYDAFFGLLKEELVPFVRKVTAKKMEVPAALTELSYPIEQQRAFANYMMDVLCFDRTRGLIKESEHPFTSGFGTSDVRITVHYYEDLMESSIFSAIHELGHATYEQQCDPALDVTFSGGGASMAMHESQSRFYENILGRSEAFWAIHFDKLKETFPEQLKDVTAQDFVKHVCRAENSLIRTEADELTYPLHIMLRYDIERALMAGELDVDGVEAKWNELVKEYFGIEVPCVSKGVLQDVHWAGGSIGYFPTYALGSAYAAQIYAAMQRDFDVEESLKEGTTARINEWLKEKIHKFGSSMPPKDILKNATGEDFNPQYYVTYLKEKYGKLYGVEA